MEIGDLLFLIMLGIGGLSSLFGSKKKNQAKGKGGVPARPAASQRPPPPPRRPPPAPRRPPPAPRRDRGLTRGPGAPQRLNDVRSHMAQILEELNLETPAAKESWNVSAPLELDEPLDQPAPPLERPARPEPVSLEIPPPPIEDELHEKAHASFHQQYIRPLPPVPVRKRGRGGSRARQFLSRDRLREAVLAKEILGRPKGLE